MFSKGEENGDEKEKKQQHMKGKNEKTKMILKNSKNEKPKCV